MSADSAQPPAAAGAAAGTGASGWVGWTAGLLLAAVLTGRVIERFSNAPQRPLAFALASAFLILFAAMPPAKRWLGQRGRWLAHIYLGLQAVLLLRLHSLPPHPDAVEALLVALSLQAAYMLPRRALAAWTAGLMLLIAASLIYWEGWVMGLALAMLPVAACLAFPAFVLARRQLEAARAESEALLVELQAAHTRLEAYAAQAEELAALQERNRLERALHDSVSQTLFSLRLNARAARAYAERDPADAEGLRQHLERIQGLAQSALLQIRGVIEELRPA